MAETSISYTVDLMQIYKAVLTPKNNVVGAKNGTSAVIRGTIIIIHHCKNTIATLKYCYILTNNNL